MPAKIIFSEEQLNQMVALYEGADSCRDIADKFSCSKNTIRAVLINAGVKFDRAAKIGIKMTGKPSSRKGAKLTKEQCDAISKRMKGNKCSVGRVVSAETRLRLSVAQKGRPGHTNGGCALLSKEEAAARNFTRQAYKRFIRRVLHLSGKRKDSTSAEIIGYSKNELRDRIESQFTDGMSWSDRSSFHIDHIVPVAVFFAHGVDDPKVINSLINLRPLSPKENKTKSSKYDNSNFQKDLAMITHYLQLSRGQKSPRMRRQCLTFDGNHYAGVK